MQNLLVEDDNKISQNLTAAIAVAVALIFTVLQAPLAYLFNLLASPTSEGEAMSKISDCCVKSSHRVADTNCNGSGDEVSWQMSFKSRTEAASNGLRLPQPVSGKQSSKLFSQGRHSEHNLQSLWTQRLVSSRQRAKIFFQSYSCSLPREFRHDHDASRSYAKSRAEGIKASLMGRWLSLPGGPLDPLQRRLFSVPRATLDPLVMSLLADLSVHAENLCSGDVQACFRLLRYWNYAPLLCDEHVVESGLATDRVVRVGLDAVKVEADVFRTAFQATKDLNVENFESNVISINEEMVKVRRLLEDHKASICPSWCVRYVPVKDLEMVKGVAILFEFLLDVIGRDSTDGKIFSIIAQCKEKATAGEVTELDQIFAVVAIAGVNILCIGVALWRSNTHSNEVQRQALVLSSLLLILELLLFETCRIIWKNVLLPLLAVDAVNEAVYVLLNLVNKVGWDAVRQLPATPLYSVTPPFNSASYLFFSSHLARESPHLLESRLVCGYETEEPSSALRVKLSADSAIPAGVDGSGASAMAGASDRVDSAPDDCWYQSIRRVRTAVWVILRHIAINVAPQTQVILTSCIVQPLFLAACVFLFFLCLEQPQLLLLVAGVVILLAVLLWTVVESVSASQLKGFNRPALPVYSRVPAAAPGVPAGVVSGDADDAVQMAECRGFDIFDISSDSSDSSMDDKDISSSEGNSSSGVSSCDGRSDSSRDDSMGSLWDVPSPRSSPSTVHAADIAAAPAAEEEAVAGVLKSESQAWEGSLKVKLNAVAKFRRTKARKKMLAEKEKKLRKQNRHENEIENEIDW